MNEQHIPNTQKTTEVNMSTGPIKKPIYKTIDEVDSLARIMDSNNSITLLNEIDTRLNTVINSVNLNITPEIISINNDLVNLKKYVNIKKEEYRLSNNNDPIVYFNKIDETISLIINNLVSISPNENLQIIYHELNHIKNYLSYKRDELTKDNKNSEKGEKMSSYESTVGISIKEELLIDVNDSLSAVIGMLKKNPLAFCYTKRLYEEFLDSIKTLYEMNKVIDDKDLFNENTGKLKSDDVFKVKVPKYIADRYNVEESVTLYSYIKTTVEFLTNIDNRIADDYTKNNRCIMPSNIAEYRERINVVIGCLVVFLKDNEEEDNSNKKVSIEVTDELESGVKEDFTTLTYSELVERRNLIDELILEETDKEIKSTIDKVYSLTEDLKNKGIELDFNVLCNELKLLSCRL